MKRIGRYLEVTSKLCHGTTTVSQDIQELGDCPHIINGVSCRISQLITGGAIKMDAVKLLILNDSDQWNNQLFGAHYQRIESILDYVPSTVRIAVFTSKLAVEITKFRRKYMPQSVLVDINGMNASPLSMVGVKQYYVRVDADDMMDFNSTNTVEQCKLEMLMDILDSVFIPKCIIYLDSKETVCWLMDRMEESDLMATMLHHEMPIQQMTRSINCFVNGAVPCLVMTDLNDEIRDKLDNEGINISRVSMVINWDLPSNDECQLRRCGSYEKRGVVVNFVGDDEVSSLCTLERQHSEEMEELPDDLRSIFR